MAAVCFQKAGDLFKEMNNTERAQILWGKAATAFLEKANDEVKHKRFEDAAKSFEKAGRVFHHKLDNPDAAANCYMRATQCRVRTANRQFRSAVAD